MRRSVTHQIAPMLMLRSVLEWRAPAMPVFLCVVLCLAATVAPSVNEAAKSPHNGRSPSPPSCPLFCPVSRLQGRLRKLQSALYGWIGASQTGRCWLASVGQGAEPPSGRRHKDARCSAASPAPGTPSCLGSFSPRSLAPTFCSPVCLALLSLLPVVVQFCPVSHLCNHRLSPSSRMSSPAPTLGTEHCEHCGLAQWVA